jgi:hypothetical protein
VPQFLPFREQKVALDSGVQTPANIWISASWNRAVSPLLAVTRSRYCW